MKLPNADRAVIDEAKLREYVLSTTHPVGRFKAAFFRSLGYEAEDWKVLESDLRSQHAGAETDEIIETVYGRKYLVRANLNGPSGKSASVVSVWIVLTGEDTPRFVTAYPGDA